MKKLYIYPQTIGVACKLASSIMLISGGGSGGIGEPGKQPAPMREAGGKQISLTTLYI